MLKKAFLMHVAPDKHDEYERRHNPIWPDLEKTLKRHGVHNYSIFLSKETNQLFGYVEIESEAQWAAIASTEVCQKWWAYMKDIMPANEDNSPQTEDLKMVFHVA